uniref:SCP domain-containing protein n=1 Tax=Strongyloides papillosus TaxID=174720 RepID=A0A0N5BHQ2_STREA
MYIFQKNNARREGSVSLDLIQNDLSSNNSISQDNLIHSIIGNIENEYLRKRQVDNKRRQIKQKSATQTKSKTNVQGKRPSKPKLPASKPPLTRHTTRKLSNVKITTRKNTAKVTTTRKSIPTRTIKPTTKPSSRTTTNKPVISTKKSTPSKTTPKITKSTSTVTTTRKRINKSKTTPKPDEYAHLKSRLISDINDLRRKHQAKNLTVDTTLANLAQKIIDEPVIIPEETVNKSVGYLRNFAPSEMYFNPLLEWGYKPEDNDYKNLDKNPFYAKFVQLVWIATTNIGCGIRNNGPNKGISTLCLFYPKGNIPGQYSENVKPEKRKKNKNM